MPIELTTRLVPIPEIADLHRLVTSPLGLLAVLPGTWTGTGFNQIFRPQTPGLDNFLELNLTTETLEFTEIPGEVPNRGMVQHDVSLFGMTYLQQVSDAVVKDTHGNPAGLHIEPGIWLNVPATTNPSEAASVARLANIPHGTSLLAQGTARVVSGAPVIPAVDITPFAIGSPASKFRFNSQTLANADPNRSPAADIVGITQPMVDDPNSVLRAALAGKTITSHTKLDITTQSSSGVGPNAGGGVADIAFLDGVGAPNAKVAVMHATFWISTYTSPHGSGTILQYSQTVLLNFNGLSWPHVSVATLTKKVTKRFVKEVVDSKLHVKSELKHETKEIETKQFELPPHLPQPGPVELGDLNAERVSDIVEAGPSNVGLAGPAEVAPAFGRHFIQPGERPDVDAVPDPRTPEKPVRKSAARKRSAKQPPETEG